LPPESFDFGDASWGCMEAFLSFGFVYTLVRLCLANSVASTPKSEFESDDVQARRIYYNYDWWVEKLARRTCA
jgi:hypothetical protein